MSGTERSSPFTAAIEWTSKITSLGFLFSLPPLVGYYLDRRLGSAQAGILVGMVVGFAVGMMYILRIARDASKPT